MDRELSTSRADAVVIGAGLGGLTAAAFLARAGLKTLVLERNAQIGGCLAALSRGEFRFDAAVHWLNQAGPGGMVRELAALLGDDFPETRPMDPARYYRNGPRNDLLSLNPDALAAALKAEFPKESAGWTTFFAAARKIGGCFADWRTQAIAPEALPLTRRPFFLAKSLHRWTPLLRYARYDTENGFRRFFRDPSIPARVFAAEETLLSCLVPIGWAYRGDYQCPPRGGASRFPEWLAGRAEARGAEILTGAEANEILVERGRVAGLRGTLRSGGDFEIRCDSVVAAVDPLPLLSKAAPNDKAVRAYLDRQCRARVFPSGFCVYVGLDCPAEELGFGPGPYFLYDGKPGQAPLSDPEHSQIVATATSIADPSIVPAGKGALTLFMAAENDAHNHWATDGERHRDPAYRALKEQFAAIMLRRVEQELAPGLSRHIIALETASPLTIARYSGSRNGAIMGFVPGGANIRLGAARYWTPIQNLYIGGQWAELGGGVPIAIKAGFNAAMLVLRRTAPSQYRALIASINP